MLWRKYFQFMNLLFIECSRRVADAGGQYQAEKGPEEALLCSQNLARSLKGEISV